VTKLVGGAASPLPKLIARQHGVISRQQALAHGLHENQVKHRSRPGGTWQRLLPGVYLTATGVPTADQADMAALLLAGDGSVITGLAALRRYPVRAPLTRQVDVLIPWRRRRASRDYVVVHRTERMPALVAYSGAIQFALPARAVADAALGLGSQSAVRALVAAAVQQRVCTVEQLAAELAAGPVRDSRWLRQAVGEAVAGVRSVPEGDLRQLIAAAELPEPWFNARLYLRGILLAVPDAWWPEAGLAVEVDSREWHFSPADWEETMRRHVRLTAAGILVLHFTPRQIRTEPAAVIAAIRAALAAGHPLPAITTRPAA
jgi:hypothetical protein